MRENIEINKLSLGALDTNCYLVACPTTQEAVIIDPAADGEAIADELLAKQLKPQAIILTHGHFDHVLGTLSLKLAFDIPVYLQPKDDFLLANAQSSAEHWTKLPADPVPPADQQLTDGQIITFGEISLQVIHTPGHTPGSCSLVYKPDKPTLSSEDSTATESAILFVGDVIFKEGFGRTDFGYSSTMQLYESIEKLKEKYAGALTYPGHGPEFYL